eukprot:1058175-Rhodomonas_salina.1
MQYVALLQQKLRRDRSQKHVSALYRHEIQPVEPSQRRHRFVHHGRPRRNHRAHRKAVLDAIATALVATAAAFAARQEKWRCYENVCHPGERHGHTVQGESEQAHR